MPKLNKPLLSLGARGTLAGTLTYQRAHSTNYVRRTPIPSYSRSDRQLWRRYLYLQACHYWNTCTPEQKAAWRTAGSKYHLTGFSFFMRFELNRLRSLMLALPLDEGKGTTATDFSSHLNDAALSNCLWLDGVIGSAVLFDGIDSYADCGTDPTLDITNQISIETWFRLSSISATQRMLLSKNYDPGYELAVWPTSAPLIFRLSIPGGGFDSLVGDYPLLIDTWYHLVATFDGSIMRLYLNADFIDSAPKLTRIAVSTDPLFIGARSPILGVHFPGTIDEPRLYDIALSQDEITRHYERR